MSDEPGPVARVGATEGDLAARALGIVRLALPIPFGQSGGPVNAYLIENADGSLTLFDVGLGTLEAKRDLERAFAEAGRRLEEVSRVLLSHGHVDHHGAARFVAERSGAKVFVHPADAGKVSVFTWPEPVRELHRAYLRRMGVPSEKVREMEGMEVTTELFGDRLDSTEGLADGERLEFARFEAQVMHLPGHTAGLVGLHVPEHRLLFSSDHLLRHVSPNPLLELGERGEQGKFRALEAYFESVARVAALELDWVLPGHGEPFRDHRAVLDSLAVFYEKRQARLLERLREAPMNAYELVLGEFGRARRLQLFLMLSEIIANLEVMETRGVIRRVEREGCYLFEPAEDVARR